jgi:hypothetical protein
MAGTRNRFLVMVLLAPLLGFGACGGGDDDAVSETLKDQSQYFDRSGAPVAELTPEVKDCGVAQPPVAVQPGTRQSVAGTVVASRLVGAPRDQTMVLEMGAAGGNVPFAIVIPERAFDNFPRPPDQLFEGQEVCVAGVVEEFMGTPAIVVTQPAEIVRLER